MGCLQSTTAVEVEDSAGTKAPGSAPALEYASSCVIPTEFKSYPLVGISKFNHDTSFFEFGLEPGQSLKLPVCGCLLARGKDSEGEAVVRPYTPTSDDEMVGKFQLLIKSYGEGKLSKYAHSLQVGDAVEFKHISFNVKFPVPSPGVNKIAMLAGGTGVAPMFQALRPDRRCHSAQDRVLYTNQSRIAGSQHRPCVQALQQLVRLTVDATQLVLLLSNRTEADILLRPQVPPPPHPSLSLKRSWGAKLADLVARAGGRLTVVHTLTGAAADWGGATGRIDRAMVADHPRPCRTLNPGAR
jgi:hypothetical protein